MKELQIIQVVGASIARPLLAGGCRNENAVLDLINTSSVGSADTFPSRGRLYAQNEGAEWVSENCSKKKSAGRENDFALCLPLEGKVADFTQTMSGRAMLAPTGAGLKTAISFDSGNILPPAAGHIRADAKALIYNEATM